MAMSGLSDGRAPSDERFHNGAEAAPRYNWWSMTRMLALALLLCISVPAHAQQPPPRAARSVHLHYPAPEADAFYNELTVEQSVPGSYFMACGFRHGYFGVQELSRGRKVVIFSVWDPTKGDEADKVPLEQRVEILHDDPDVEVKRFGGEGT